MLRQKLQYLGHRMQRSDLLEKTLMLGKTEGKRRRGRQRMRWLDAITDSVDMNLSNTQETVEEKGSWHATVHGVTRVGRNLATITLDQYLKNVTFLQHFIYIYIYIK